MSGNENKRIKRNIKISNKRKQRRKELIENNRDNKLYYEASILTETLEGQIRKDVSELIADDKDLQEKYKKELQEKQEKQEKQDNYNKNKNNNNNKNNENSIYSYFTWIPFLSK